MLSLKFDTDSLRKLFPEGSQACLDLQAAVIKNVVDHAISKKLGDEISAEIHRQVNTAMGSLNIAEIVKKQFEDVVEKRWGSHNVFDANIAGIRKLKEVIEKAVEKESKDVVQNILDRATIEAVDKLVSNQDAYVQNTINTIEARATNVVRSTLQNKYPQIIDEAIQARLFPIKPTLQERADVRPEAVAGTPVYVFEGNRP